MKISSLSILALIALPFLGFSQDIPEGWFPFQTNAREAYDDALGSVEFLNPGPADKRIVAKDGHFTLEDGTKIRFFGSNIAFANAFPDKEVSPVLAKRLKQIGFNVMRFHSMERNHIWNRDQTALDPVQLDKLHWFLYHLKLNGVYANLNLHVSRRYRGMSAEMIKEFGPGKALDRFYPPFIQMQKEYARDLLTTVNPYTGLTPAEDPMVAFVEINNENAITSLVQEDKIRAIQGTEYYTELQKQWKDWLVKKYGSTAKLAQEWQRGFQTLSKDNLLEGLKPEGEHLHPDNFVLTAENSKDIKIDLKQDGEVAWAYQTHFLDIPFKENQNYTITFKAKASKQRYVNFSLMAAEPPWLPYARTGANLYTEWNTYALSLRIDTYLKDKRTRLTIGPGGFNTPVIVEIKDLELHEGNIPLDFDHNNIPLEIINSSINAKSDYINFLAETEYETTRTLMDYIKKDLKVKSLVIDSQVNYSGAFGFIRESQLSDYMDTHFYWQHPTFAPGKNWDGNHWTIRNTPMTNVKAPYSYAYLMTQRAQGKPFSISEYDHPAPNEHNHELFPLIASFAAFQDWDAIYQFSFASPPDFKTPAAMRGYFAMAGNPGKMTFSPLAALIYRNGLVKPSPNTITLEIPKKVLFDDIKGTVPTISSIKFPNADFNKALPDAQINVKLTDDGDQPKTIPADIAQPDINLKSSQITWDASNDRGTYLVNAPAARTASGYIQDKPVILGDVKAELTLPQERTASFAIVACDSLPIAESKSMLLAIVGTIANPGMIWNEERTTIKTNWGNPPAIAIFIPATITIPGEKKPVVKALDPAGRAFADIPVEGTPGAWTFKTTQDSPTLWFSLKR